MVHGKYAIDAGSEWEILDLFGNPIKGTAEYKGEIFYVVSELPTQKLIKALKAKPGSCK